MNPAKDILSKSHAPNSGHGTPLSGYIESPVPRTCGLCEYKVGTQLCNNRQVLRDPRVPKDIHSGLKIIDPVYGCCDEWVASKQADKRAAKGDFEKALNSVVENKPKVII